MSMRKCQEHRVGLLGDINNYINKIILWYIIMRNFDDNRTEKIVGFFCEVLVENKCTILEIRTKEVDWEFTSKNKNFKKLIGRDIKSYDELTFEEKKLVGKLERKWGKRWQKKALKRYLMDIDGSSTEEKLNLIKDIKAELEDKESSDLKTLVGRV